MMFLPPHKKDKKKSTKPQKGFTLIELLVVIGILAVLLAIVLIAINPPRQFALARNTQRRSDALAILNAVGQYYAEEGKLPAAIATGSPQPISNSGANICSDLVERYLAGMPVDPLTDAPGPFSYSSCASYNSGYTILKTSSNRVTVEAPNAEDPDGGGNPPTIQITR
jgi:type IV pilus assembly protein PilA